MPSTDATLAGELNSFGSHSDYLDTLVFFEYTQPTLDDNLVTETIRENSLIHEYLQSIHVLNGQRHILAVAKSKNNTDRLDSIIINLFREKYPELRRIEIPLTSKCVNPLLLIAELNDSQLKVVDNNVEIAIKLIEAKTGLQSLKQTRPNSFFFTGILFQFVVLNDFLKELGSKNLILNEMNQNVKKESISVCPVNESKNNISGDDNKVLKLPNLDWQRIYEDSEVKGHFRIRPKHQNEGENIIPDVYYDIYMFVADLTDLNTDGLVNAANPNLHPGYTGDGIARRIRAKAGKQMQDACKKIIRQEHNNENIQEGEVVLTKSSGKLKSKYVLHAVAPTWTNHIINSPPITTPRDFHSQSPSSSMSSMVSMNSSPTSSISSASNASICEKFEYLLEKTFVNILQQANDPKLHLQSLAIPVSDDGLLGGAFDMPVELFAHSLYTQLCEYPIEKNNCLKTFCISSLEADTIKILCNTFANYTDNYSESSWAMPLSPINRLVSSALMNRPVVIESEVSTKVERSPTIQETSDSYHLNSNTGQMNFKSEENLNKIVEPLQENYNDLKEVTPKCSEDDASLTTDLGDLTISSQNNDCMENVDSAVNKPMESLTVTIKIKDENVSNNSSSDSTSIRLITTNGHEVFPRSFDENILGNMKANRRTQQRTVSNSSYSSENSGGVFDKSRLNFSTRSSESSCSSIPGTGSFKNVDMNSKSDVSCLFCQRENKAQLVTCWIESCKGVYCHNCILNYFKNQKMHKCPSCRTSVDRQVINNLKDRYSSSPEPVRLMSIQNTAPVSTNKNANNGNVGFNYNRLKFSNHQNNISGSNNSSGKSSSLTQTSSQIKNTVNDAKVYVRIVDEPCDGYENFKTIIVTFEVEDGIQSDNHPRPGSPFKGTTKKVYLPEVPEHREILAFYEKALRAGKLFKIAYSRTYDDYRVLLNQDVLLKTSQHGGGRFGYPDYSYVKDLIYMARKQQI